MRIIFCALIVTGMVGASVGTAVANERNGYQAIARGDYAAAEHMIVAERRMFPHDPDLTLNLAAIYLHSGRTAEARSLYRDVLARPNEQLDLPKQSAAWSHEIATRALRGLDRQQISLR